MTAIFSFKGGVAIATTYIRPYKAAGKGAVQTMEERFDYGLNPDVYKRQERHLAERKNIKEDGRTFSRTEKHKRGRKDT